VISLESQVAITSHRNKWANTDPVYTDSGIWWLGGVSILCQPTTLTTSPTSCRYIRSQSQCANYCLLICGKCWTIYGSIKVCNYKLDYFNGHKTWEMMRSNKTVEIHVTSICPPVVYLDSKMWNLYFKFQYFIVEYINVIHENYFNNSNVMKSVELRRCIHLSSRLSSNQIAKLPAGIFDQLVKLHEL
jgi:hypothetical protein